MESIKKTNNIERSNMDIVVFVMRDKKTKGGIFLSFMTIFVFMINWQDRNVEKSQK